MVTSITLDLKLYGEDRTAFRHGRKYCAIEVGNKFLVNFFAAGCKTMQYYVIQLYNIMQQYIICGDISSHIHRLIVVNDRFCGDNGP